MDHISISVSAVGYLAAFCTTAAFLPQVVRIIRTRETSGISITMYSTFTIGVALWLLYGIALANWPMIIANAITLMLAGTVLWLTIAGHIAANKTDTGTHTDINE